MKLVLFILFGNAILCLCKCNNVYTNMYPTFAGSQEYYCYHSCVFKIEGRCNRSKHFAKMHKFIFSTLAIPLKHQHVSVRGVTTLKAALSVSLLRHRVYNKFICLNFYLPRELVISSTYCFPT